MRVGGGSNSSLVRWGWDLVDESGVEDWLFLFPLLVGW